MKNTILYLATLFFLSFLPNSSSLHAENAALNEKLLKLPEIRKELLSIENNKFKKIDLSGELDCGVSYSLIAYFDENDIIRKFIYSGESCSGDSSRESVNYFTSSEQLYFQFYSEDIIPESSILKGNAYYNNEQIVFASFKEFIESNPVKNPYPEYQIEMEEIIAQRAIRSGKILRKWYLVPSKSSDHNKIVLFRKPEIGDTTIVNSPDATLFEHPDFQSKKLLALLPFDSVHIIEVGDKDILEPWGDNYWYYVEGHSNSNKTVGWIYGVYLEYVETNPE